MRIKFYVQVVKEVLEELHSNNGWREGYNSSRRYRHWIARFLWIIAFGLLLTVCGAQIFNMWTKWDANPVKIEVSSRVFAISSIPFPTVTICPQTKTYRDKLDIDSIYRNIEASPLLYMNNLTDLEKSRLEALAHICYDNPLFGHLNNSFLNESIYQIIQDMAPTCNDTLAYCRWQNKILPCQELLKPVFTDEGLCFAFNALNSHETYTNEMVPEMFTVTDNPNISNWDQRYGFVDDGSNLNGSHYPLRVSNLANGLLVLPQLIKYDLSYACRGLFQGFTVTLSSPDEAIGFMSRLWRISTYESAVILIKPKYTFSSKKLRSYEPAQRHCFYNDERQLRFYKFYTERNCESECLSNFTLAKCGCVKFPMPRDKETKICGAKNLKCVYIAGDEFHDENINIIDGKADTDAISFRRNCHCLTACTTVEYHIQIDRTKINVPSGVEKVRKYEPSLITISFEDSVVDTQRRSAVYTPTDFLAACGGLLGLFLGLSALSLIQYLLNFTLCLFWVLRKKKNTVTIVAPFHRTNNMNKKHIRGIVGSKNKHTMKWRLKY